MTCH